MRIVDETDMEFCVPHPTCLPWHWGCYNLSTYLTDHRILVRLDQVTRRIGGADDEHGHVGAYSLKAEKNPLEKESTRAIIDHIESQGHAWNSLCSPLDVSVIDSGLVVRISNRLVSMDYVNWLVSNWSGPWEWATPNSDPKGQVWFRRESKKREHGTVLAVLMPLDPEAWELSGIAK